MFAYFLAYQWLLTKYNSFIAKIDQLMDIQKHWLEFWLSKCWMGHSWAQTNTPSDSDRATWVQISRDMSQSNKRFITRSNRRSVLAYKTVQYCLETWQTCRNIPITWTWKKLEEWIPWTLIETRLCYQEDFPKYWYSTLFFNYRTKLGSSKFYRRCTLCCYKIT
jgi:hypothetical protein